jgi:hypothetical protein
MFQAIVTSDHSPRALSSPRMLIWRQPITHLMIPNTGSTVCLGSPCVALRYVEEHLPGSYDIVRGFFGRSGACSRLKRLLERCGKLDAWHEYEARAVEHAQRAWVDKNVFRFRLHRLRLAAPAQAVRAASRDAPHASRRRAQQVRRLAEAGATRRQSICCESRFALFS